MNKINCLSYFIILLFAYSCNNSMIEEFDSSKNDLTIINSNESLTSQLRQIYSSPSLSTRTIMFDLQESDKRCFQFVYPISFTLPDGSEITINSDEGWDEIDHWYEENKDSEDGPKIEYPFSIRLDSSIFEVSNDFEFLELIYLIINFCIEIHEDYNDECFEFVYPISFILPDGSEITINNDEGWDEIDHWYEENKDSDEDPEIIYPFDVTLDDDKVMTINNEKDFKGLKDYCD